MEKKQSFTFSFSAGDEVRFGPWATIMLRQDFDKKKHQVISIKGEFVTLENGRTYSRRFFVPAKAN